MDISNKVPPIQSTPYIKEAAKGSASDATGTINKGDKVELSAKAQELQAARETINTMDDVDQAKVAEIKAKIEAGTYKVDAKKIAEKMIEESLL